MGHGGGGGGHATSIFHKRDRDGADCNWTTHFLVGGRGLTVLLRLIVKGLPESKTLNGAPNIGTAVQFLPTEQREYLKLLLRVRLMVATSSVPGIENGFVLIMARVRSIRKEVQLIR